MSGRVCVCVPHDHSQFRLQWHLQLCPLCVHDRGMCVASAAVALPVHSLQSHRLFVVRIWLGVASPAVTPTHPVPPYLRLECDLGVQQATGSYLPCVVLAMVVPFDGPRFHCCLCDCVMTSREQYHDHCGGKKHRKQELLAELRSGGGEGRRTITLVLAPEPRHVVQMLGRLAMILLIPGVGRRGRSVILCVYHFLHRVAVAHVNPSSLEARLRNLRQRFERASDAKPSALISSAGGLSELPRAEGPGEMFAPRGRSDRLNVCFRSCGTHLFQRRGGKRFEANLAMAHMHRGSKVNNQTF